MWHASSTPGPSKSTVKNDWTFALYTSMHGVTGSPSFWSSIRKVWFLVRFFISLRVAFSQGSFMFSDNFLLQQIFLVLEWSWKLLNQILPKVSILAKISFTTVLNTLCKPFPVLRVAFNAPFRSGCLCLIRSHIL